ncbi:MAG: IS66 family insertion sequence element accessory protein TnpB [Solirubrobacteraceae bacterium]
MMALSAHVRVLVCVAAIDFRKGIDGLARVCREVLSADPFSGTVFVFRNRRGTAIKLLAYDGQGFWLCQKRLSEGRFRHWPGEAGSAQRELLAHQLQVLLAGGDAEAMPGAPTWRRIGTEASAPV